MSDRLFHLIGACLITLILVGGMATSYIYNDYKSTQRQEMGLDPECSALDKKR